MKRFKIVLILCFLTFMASCGQQKRYVSYKVQEGETMRDIAKRLEMKTKDLLRLNPDVGRRPDANTVIIIPNPKNGKKTSDAVREETTEVSETVTTTPTVTETTEEVTETVSTNVPDLKELEELKKNFVVHVAKPKETVYGLKRFYNVPIDSIYELNPGLKESGLKIGQVVKIKKIETEEDKEEAEEITAMYADIIKPDTNVNVAFLLPFSAKKYDSVPPVDIFGIGRKSRLVNMTTDFYMGAQIAIDSLTKQGVNIKAVVFDTGKKGANVSKILSEEKLKDIDVVIGPFYSDKAEQVARGVKVPVIFPHYSKNQAQFSSGKLVKTAPDTNSNTSYLVEYLRESYNGETIFVVGDGKSVSNAQVNKIVTGLQKHDSIGKIHILKPKNGYIKKERFTDHMKPKTHSWVIMTSDDNVTVADGLNSVVVLPEEVTAQVFAVDKNEAYDKIDNNKLARINLAYVTNSFIDEQSEATKTFDQMYRKKNYTLPSSYAIKGFDVTYDILMRMASGDDLTDTFKKGASLRIESKYDYDKKMFGATQNKGLFIVKFNKDLTLERLK